MLSIAAIEQETGILKDTLRVWERRYGFPMPTRDEQGERSYTQEELTKLRLLKRLIDLGQRPGKIVSLPLADLQALGQELSSKKEEVKRTRGRPKKESNGEPSVPTIAVKSCLPELLSALRNHRVDSLQLALQKLLTELGLVSFVTTIIAPLTYEVGEAWGRGELEVFEEHIFTEQLTLILRSAIANVSSNNSALASQNKRPRILLTTFPSEPHSLGLLMAQAIMTVASCSCISLGVQTPLSEIARAALVEDVDIVALSFSIMQNGKQINEGLTNLRKMLPEKIEIWAGGQNPALQRHPPQDIVIIGSLEGIPAAVAAWRERRFASAA